MLLQEHYKKLVTKFLWKERQFSVLIVACVVPIMK